MNSITLNWKKVPKKGDEKYSVIEAYRFRDGDWKKVPKKGDEKVSIMGFDD